MPSGNPQNMKPMNTLTVEEQKKIARAGGIASGKARRNKAILKDCLNILLEQKILNPETGKKITGAEQLSTTLWLKALTELDTAKAAKAFEVIRDTAGQKPAEKIMLAEVEQSVIDEIESIVLSNDN